MKTITLANRDQKSYRVSGRASLLTELIDQGSGLTIWLQIWRLYNMRGEIS